MVHHRSLRWHHHSPFGLRTVLLPLRPVFAVGHAVAYRQLSWLTFATGVAKDRLNQIDRENAQFLRRRKNSQKR